MFLICDTRGVDQRRFRVLDVDAKGNLYLYKTALLCKNEIIKRLRNGTYSLAEQTKLGMIFLFYFLRHQYKLVKKSEIDLNTSVLFTSCPCILRFIQFNVILSRLGISKCVCTCVAYFPRKMKPLSWVHLQPGWSFLDYFFIFLFFLLKTKYFYITKSWIAKDPAPICDPTK